jgi:SRSO17 transposase
LTPISRFDLQHEMNRRELARLERELREYLDGMVEGMGRVERKAAMRNYVVGLLLDGERKSVEPMAARLVDAPKQIGAMRQRLLDCVGKADWRESEILRRLACKLEGELPGVEALVVDDTGFPKKGELSVGVARQYSGTLGRTDNCQVATSLHLAGEQGSGCIGLTVYLPESWTSDRRRCRAAGVPKEIGFRRKWEIALAQIDEALRWGVRRHLVLADAGYGDTNEFREGLTARGLEYVVGVTSTTVVWRPSSNPRLLQRKPGTPGRPRTRYRDEKNPPLAMNRLSPKLEYREISWREGTKGMQRSRFAAVRVRTAHRHMNGAPPGDEQWLICEWPSDEPAPTKHWLSTLPPTTSLAALVRRAKLRWRVERDYQEMKGELGLDHYEGRSWRGFHHHAALCALAHGFLTLRRALFPPEEDKVDAADGAQRAADRPPPDRGLLPSLQTNFRSEQATTRAVSCLSEAIG